LHVPIINEMPRQVGAHPVLEIDTLSRLILYWKRLIVAIFPASYYT
jgi:hypothetical protein